MRLPTSLTLCLAASSLSLSAQTTIDLATNHDGSILLFTVTTPPANSQLFRWTLTGGLTLLAQRPVVPPATACYDEAWSQFSRPNLSADGLGGRRRLQGQLSVIDLATGIETRIARGQGPHRAQFADNGRLIYYLDAATPGPFQIFSVATDGSGRRQLTSINGGVLDFTVSPAARVLFLVTPTSLLHGDTLDHPVLDLSSTQ